MIKKILRNRLLPKIYKLYLSFNLKAEELIINSDDKCLLIAPHADDESIGMGGTLSIYPKNFNVVCLTNGYKGIKSLPKEIAKEVRKIEFANAMKAVNISSFETIDIDDKSVIENFDKFSDIEIADFDYIFIPNIIDQHIDHKSVSINLSQLIDKKPHKKSLRIVFYEVWSSLPMPNAYVDISSVVDIKRDMIDKHKSQVEAKDYTTRILGLNKYRSLSLKKVEYAEAFLVMDIKLFNKVISSCL